MTNMGKSNMYFMKLIISVFSKMSKKTGEEKIISKYLVPTNSQGFLRL